MAIFQLLNILCLIRKGANSIIISVMFLIGTGGDYGLRQSQNVSIGLTQWGQILFSFLSLRVFTNYLFYIKYAEIKTKEIY